MRALSIPYPAPWRLEPPGSYTPTPSSSESPPTPELPSPVALPSGPHLKDDGLAPTPAPSFSLRLPDPLRATAAGPRLPATAFLRDPATAAALVADLYLPRASTRAAYFALLGLVVTQLVVVCALAAFFIVGGVLYYDQFKERESAWTAVAGSVVIALYFSISLSLLVRTFVAVSRVRLSDPLAKATLDQVLCSVTNWSTWLIFWNVLLFAITVYQALRWDIVWIYLQMGLNIVLVFLPSPAYALHVYCSTHPTVLMFLTAPLSSVVSISMAMYMSVVAAQEQEQFGWTGTSIVVHIVQLIFLLPLCWSMNHVAAPWALRFTTVQYRPQAEPPSEGPEEELATARRTMATQLEAVRSITKGNLLEGLGFVDAILLQAVVYIVLLLAIFFLTKCSGSCATRRFALLGLIIMPCASVGAVIVSLVASYMLKKSDVVIINQPLALLCPGVLSFDFVEFVCELARQAYLVDSKQIEELGEWCKNTGIDLLEVLVDEATSTEGFIASLTSVGEDGVPTRALFVAFTGTANTTDACIDLRFWRHPWEVAVDEQLHRKPRVHSGFLAQWMSIRDQVLQAVEKWGQGAEQVYVTGHSLGGAVATLCATNLAQLSVFSQEVSVCLITFGSPKVGNFAFSQEHNRLLPLSFHFHNLGDPVPGLPSGTYTVHGHRIPMANDKLLSTIERFLNMLLSACGRMKPTCHFIGEYLRRLQVAHQLSTIPQWRHFKDCKAAPLRDAVQRLEQEVEDAL